MSSMFFIGQVNTQEFIGRAGLRLGTGLRTGAVTLIQRLGERTRLVLGELGDSARTE